MSSKCERDLELGGCHITVDLGRGGDEVVYLAPRPMVEKVWIGVIQRHIGRSIDGLSSGLDLEAATFLRDELSRFIGDCAAIKAKREGDSE